MLFPKARDTLVLVLAALLAIYLFGYALPAGLRPLVCQLLRFLEGVANFFLPEALHVDFRPDWVGECGGAGAGAVPPPATGSVNAATLCALHGGVKWTIGGPIDNPLVGCHDGTAFDVKTGRPVDPGEAYSSPWSSPIYA